jgi:hypothetical protein
MFEHTRSTRAKIAGLAIFAACEAGGAGLFRSCTTGTPASGWPGAKAARLRPTAADHPADQPIANDRERRTTLRELAHD